MTPQQAWELSLLALCGWREARGQSLQAIQAQLWSVRNRVLHPSWWGHGWAGVILDREQYSSFNSNDPNAAKFPTVADAIFPQILNIAATVYAGACDDLSKGADSYYSIDIAAPAWTTSKLFTVQAGAFRFYRSPTS
jgi:N-acetylmuramoyl-L-alanine amidase